MAVDQQIVEELRRMFLDGATPSRLVRYVVTNAPERDDSERLRRVVQSYFDEAFGILLRRIPLDPADLRNSFSNPGLNQIPLHRIVQGRAEWASQRKDEDRWLGELKATNPGQLNDSVDLSRETELAGVIDDLDDPARMAIKRWIGNINYLYELVEILAALAERLQDKIDRLEEQIGHEAEPVGAGHQSLES